MEHEEDDVSKWAALEAELNLAVPTSALLQASSSSSSASRARAEREARFHASLSRALATLKRAAWNEKCAPELLPYESEAVDLLTEYLNEMDLSVFKSDQHVVSTLREMDADRARYVSTSYLRTRIWKIKKHPLHFSSPDNIVRMSPAEVKFVQKYLNLKDKTLTCAVLSRMPESMDSNVLEHLVTHPEMSTTYVMVRVLKDLGEVYFGKNGTEPRHQMKAGSILVAPYEPVRGFLVRGDVELV